METKQKILISGLATGIGSLPYIEPKKAVDLILSYIPKAPFWPQLVKKDWREGMVFQYSDGTPALIPDSKRDKLILNPKEDKENALAVMYGKYLENDIDYFKIFQRQAKGLYYFLDELKPEDLKDTIVIKGQVTGPFTFAFSSTDSFGKSLLYDEAMLEAIAKVLAMKAVWQVEKLKKFDKPIIIFFDEPYLSSFGSAFCPLSRERVISLLREVFNIVRKKTSRVFIGIHCCGNTDWSMLFKSGVDIINFDAWDYLNKFVLYPKEIKIFLEKGGFIAWGIVPTNGFQLKISIEELKKKFKEGIQNLVKKDIDKELIIQNTLFTPSCGLGTRTEEETEYVFRLLSQTQDLVNL